MVKQKKLYRYSTLEGGFLNWKRLGDGFDYASPIQYENEYRQVELEKETVGSESESECSEERQDDEDSGGRFAFLLRYKTIFIRNLFFRVVNR